MGLRPEAGPAQFTACFDDAVYCFAALHYHACALLPPRRCCSKGRNFVYIHIQPQHECIITESGGWAVDFVGRVEEIDRDLRQVLQELEQRRPPDAPPVRAGRTWWGEKEGSTRQYRDSGTGHHLQCCAVCVFVVSEQGNCVSFAALLLYRLASAAAAGVPACSAPHVASGSLRLQVKPLEGSLANVNGRGCNESASGVRGGGQGAGTWRGMCQYGPALPACLRRCC